MSGLAHAPVESVPIAPLSPERFASVLDERGFAAVEALIGRAHALLDGRTVWCINSTATGGGVAEMLASLVAYAQGGGIDCRWVTIQGEEEFFRITKRLHNRLHGSLGDGGDLGPAEREAYERALQPAAEALGDFVKAGDIVLVHDPQPAGLNGVLKELGAHVVWRAHIGADEPNDCVQTALDFLLPYVEPADLYVFSRASYAWHGLDPGRVHVIAPSIDVFAPKNQDMSGDHVMAILATAGLVAGRSSAEPRFERLDGETGVVTRRAAIREDAPVPPDAPLVLQVSRWDRLKDHIGVMRGFAAHVRGDAHLVLAGPAAEAVADDPEGAESLDELRRAHDELDADARARVHIACLPMDDRDENAAMVNALQRHASVVVQKSLAEGFGLTVAEAMWKGRPVVASRVGGIQEQVIQGQTGLLVEPEDLDAFGSALNALLDDSARAAEMGARGRERVLELFLGTRNLAQWVDVSELLLAQAARS
jgi:trehalose synthase